jgi:hypothetical protein
MSDFMPKWVAEIWTWTRENDLPNWISVALASFIWPVALVIWSRRKVNGVEGLQVRMGRGNITIGSAHHDAVAIEFINNTGSVVYIT